MRVILKPGGIMFIVAAVGVLSLLVFSRPRADGNPRNAPKARTLPGEQPAPDKVVILRGSMETFLPVAVCPKTSEAEITGDVATGFLDNSDWAELSVDYFRDMKNPHGTAL